MAEFFYSVEFPEAPFPIEGGVDNLHQPRSMVNLGNGHELSFEMDEEDGCVKISRSDIFDPANTEHVNTVWPGETKNIRVRGLSVELDFGKIDQGNGWLGGLFKRGK